MCWRVTTRVLARASKNRCDLRICGFQPLLQSRAGKSLRAGSGYRFSPALQMKQVVRTVGCRGPVGMGFPDGRHSVRSFPACLSGLSREDLLALVREQIAEDRQLRRRRAARPDPGELTHWLVARCSATSTTSPTSIRSTTRRRSASGHGRSTRAAGCRQAEPLTRRTGDTVYGQLVDLLLSIRDCHQRLGAPDECAAYVTALRTAHQRKRNLMWLMDEHGCKPGPAGPDPAGRSGDDRDLLVRHGVQPFPASAPSRAVKRCCRHCRGPWFRSR